MEHGYIDEGEWHARQARYDEALRAAFQWWYDYSNSMVEQYPDAKVPNDVLLDLYARYKQATVGDVVERKIGFFDLRNKAKQAAWTAMRGIDPRRAMEMYVVRLYDYDTAERARLGWPPLVDAPVPWWRQPPLAQ